MDAETETEPQHGGEGAGPEVRFATPADAPKELPSGAAVEKNGGTAPDVLRVDPADLQQLSPGAVATYLDEVPGGPSSQLAERPSTPPRVDPVQGDGQTSGPIVTSTTPEHKSTRPGQIDRRSARRFADLVDRVAQVARGFVPPLRADDLAQAFLAVHPKYEEDLVDDAAVLVIRVLRAAGEQLRSMVCPQHAWIEGIVRSQI